MLERHNPTILNLTQQDAVSKDEVTNLVDAGIRFAFGIEGFLDKELKSDPAYVKWLVRTVRRVDGVETEKFLPFHRCRPEEYDDFATPSESAVYTLNKYKMDADRDLLCLDWDDLRDELEVWGYWTDNSSYQRIEFILAPCNYIHDKNGWQGDTIHEDCIADLT